MGDTPQMRGYFGVGVEGISKSMNLGNLMRSAHAFGASFFFTVDARRTLIRPKSDTSRTNEQVPVYNWNLVEDMQLPAGCSLVGVELTEDAIDLPSFGHPRRAAYVLGPERGSLSPEMMAQCRHIIRIPAGFCINLATAGAIVMYDRLRAHGRYPERAVHEGAPPLPRDTHIHGGPRYRQQRQADLRAANASNAAVAED
ncbi:RNA methyltransferase [Tepidamorphus sp. 3E244]|uniref:RNA methyltransferase n=1 Tax=Tepidamorphus sp. 3E244 TaxID=3385498 RepID=UPI0038FCB7E8